MRDPLRDCGTRVASIHASCAPGEREDSSWGWAVRILWRDTGQRAFLGEGRELPQGSKPNEGGLGVSGEGTAICFFLAIAGRMW